MKQLISNQEIDLRLSKIAEEINSKFDKVTLLVTLTGGVYTAIDLSKYLTIPCKLEFVKVSSYGSSEESGIVELKWISIGKGTKLDNVIIIDDIFDTGKTMDYLLKFVKNNYTYDSLNTMVLLDKPERREIPNNIDYIGFEIPNYFVFGYGLDLDGYERNKSGIWRKI